MPVKHVISLLAAMLILGTGLNSAVAQTKKKKNPRQPPPAPATVTIKDEEPKSDGSPTDLAAKRNSRPTEEPQRQIVVTPLKSDPLYTYEFTQPNFLVPRIVIEHDDSGKGTIAFSRRGGDETFTEKLVVSETTLKKLKTAFAALNFIDSAENYQHERDFSHLGNSSITLASGAKSRTIKINYTLNKNAKLLIDEYRKIANQALWVFDITIARENQPLEGPTHMSTLDGLLKRGEIADPLQLLTFLRELADDERLPLIARNHATRIIQQIERANK
jgi:hypothetical protein